MSEIWAKTAPDDGYITVQQHLADAGAVAERLWTIALTGRQRSWIAASLGLDVEEARRVFVFLASVHDIGKASPSFQSLAPELAHRLLSGDLLSELAVAQRVRHDAIGGAVLLEWLKARGVGREAREGLAAAIAGHHGQLRSSRALEQAAYLGVAPAPAWQSAQAEILDGMARYCDADAALGRVAAGHSPALVALAGLISVADWIASDTRYFAVPRTSGQAPAELAARGVHGPSWVPLPRPVEAGFAELFSPLGGSPRVPRALQQAVVVLLAQPADGPQLLIVEDRTGAGKTEAAFWAIRQGVAAGARGFYIGMPTRATADQLHQRTQAFVERAWPDVETLGLLHGGVLPEEVPVPSAVELDGAREAAEDGDEAWRSRFEDADARAAAAAEWFAGKRRGLLAPAAVGTIDQALLASLNAKHFPVRLWGLQGKVVVFDEVHAFDSYTGLVMERAVHWLAAMDCTVVLLSATLPVARRRSLVAAFRDGISGEPSRPPAREAVLGGYPRLTTVDRGGFSVHSVSDDRPSRSVGLSVLAVAAADDDQSVVDAALRAVADGGCAAIVCNTVASAQRRFRLLAQQSCADTELVLLHARTRPVERTPIEQRLMDELGPHRTAANGRPTRMILVATQIIEQSLDLDLDVMFSDLAPIDLLVQRAGRVHRHQREARPAAHAAATLVVIDTSGDDVFRPTLLHSDAVYPEALLCRTRLVLRGREKLTEPDDLDELIEAVYDVEPPCECRDDERERLATIDAAAAQTARALASDASSVAINHFDVDEPLWERAVQARRDPDELGSTVANSAATRWADRPSLSVVIVRAGELEDLWSRTAPAPRLVAELLRRSVSISSMAVVGPVTEAWKADRDADRPARRFHPPSWDRHPLLRHQLLIELDAGGASCRGALGRSDIELALHHDLIEGVRMGKDAA